MKQQPFFDLRWFGVHRGRGLKVLLLAGLILWMALAFSCRTGGNAVMNRNFAPLYNPASTSIHPKFLVFHQNDSVSNLFFELEPGEFLFNRANEAGELVARVRIRWILYAFAENNAIQDSASVLFNLNNPSLTEGFVSYLPLRLARGRYTLEVETSDLNKKTQHIVFIHIDKMDTQNRQNFLVTRKRDLKILFDPWVTSSDTLIIRNNRAKTDSCTIRFYPNNQAYPQVPYSLGTPKPQVIPPTKVFGISLGDTAGLHLSEEGYYHLSVGIQGDTGLTLFNFGPFHPMIRQANAMVYPLRYLTTGKEFNKLIDAPDEKAAVDSFWLSVSGNPDRARELIRVFYSRVAFANIYFQAESEGWKTDRGMLYVILGPPKTIYKSNDSERWIYGDEKTLVNMDFFFQKEESRFSENKYLLRRSEIFKTSWFQAVDTWRGGRVYSVGN